MRKGLSRDCSRAGLSRLKEAAKQSAAWYDRARDAISATAELRVLELLSTEACELRLARTVS